MNGIICRAGTNVTTQAQRLFSAFPSIERPHNSAEHSRNDQNCIPAHFPVCPSRWIESEHTIILCQSLIDVTAEVLAADFPMRTNQVDLNHGKD